VPIWPSHAGRVPNSLDASIVPRRAILMKLEKCLQLISTALNRKILFTAVTDSANYYDISCYCCFLNCWRIGVRLLRKWYLKCTCIDCFDEWMVMSVADMGRMCSSSQTTRNGRGLVMSLIFRLRQSLKCPSVRSCVHTYIRITSVHPQKVLSISMKFAMQVEVDQWCTTVCSMTRSKVKVTSPSKLEIRPSSKAISSAIYNGSWQLIMDS